MKKNALIIFLFSIVSSINLAAQNQVHHWETIVYANDVWKYFPGVSDPGMQWKNPGFDDAAWSSGPGGVGYGDNDDGTVIGQVMSVFIRRKFSIVNVDDIEKLMLSVDYDDGFVAYLNGTEIARSMMGTNPVIPYDQPSAGLHEAVLYQGGIPEPFNFDREDFASLLVNGENTLAVQVHNDNAGSSDLSSAVFLSAGMRSAGTTYRPVPSWFIGTFDSSDLPIIKIETNGQTIMDEDRIIANMDVIYNGAGLRNSIFDTPTDYSGNISIEVRGESSQMFPKKSYSLETQDGSGNNLNVALLGMPPENDWVLYAPYTDKTLMRDVLTYKLGRDMGHYAPRTQYVELILNGDYVGVYVLMERIKRDKNRVDVASLTSQDISGDDLTGGYVLRVDKIDPNDYPAWTSVPVPQLNGTTPINFQFSDPEGTELLTVQQNYIRNFIFQFESALSGTNFKTADGYKKYIDVPAFMDFMIVNEIGKNIDGYLFSTYLHKQKDSDGGKLVMGPLWDFNLAYGNVDYSQNAQFAPGWIYEETHRMYWFRRLLQDPGFANIYKCRWNELRTTFMTNDYFNNQIDSMAVVLDESRKRNFQRWNILGQYVWPNQYVGQTYADEIAFMKQWIMTRLAWMDNNMPGNCTVTSEEPTVKDFHVTVFPNPSASGFTITSSRALQDGKVVILNSLGVKIFETSMTDSIVWDTADANGKQVPAGLYFVRIESDGKPVGTIKVIRE